jgi:membrane-associated phospholipid phosphatase
MPARRSLTSKGTPHDTITGLLLVALLGVVTTAVAKEAVQPFDDAVRRHQPRPRRGVRHALAKGIKAVLRPEAQIAVGAAAALYLHRRGVPRAHLVVTAVTCTVLADRGIKHVLDRSRPPGYRGNKRHESFPSGHTASAAAISVTVSHLLQRAGDASAPHAALGTWAATALVAESRLLLDEHWPSDVVGGALLGAAVAHTVLAI